MMQSGILSNQSRQGKFWVWSQLRSAMSVWEFEEKPMKIRGVIAERSRVVDSSSISYRM